MIIEDQYTVNFVRAPGGVVDLLVTEEVWNHSLRAFDIVERVRLGFTPEELDRLLTEGRVALYESLGLSV